MTCCLGENSARGNSVYQPKLSTFSQNIRFFRSSLLTADRRCSLRASDAEDFGIPQARPLGIVGREPSGEGEHQLLVGFALGGRQVLDLIDGVVGVVGDQLQQAKLLLEGGSRRFLAIFSFADFLLQEAINFGSRTSAVSLASEGEGASLVGGRWSGSGDCRHIHRWRERLWRELRRRERWWWGFDDGAANAAGFTLTGSSGRELRLPSGVCTGHCFSGVGR